MLMVKCLSCFLLIALALKHVESCSSMSENDEDENTVTTTMTFSSGVSTATFNDALKNAIRETLKSLLPDFDVEDIANDMKLKEMSDGISLVTFSQKLNDEDAEKLINEFKDTDFPEKFNNKIQNNQVNLKSISAAIEVPDGKRNPDLVAVEKENGIKSLIKVDAKENVEKKVEEGTIICSKDQEQAECPKGYYCSKLNKAKNGTCQFNPTVELCHKSCDTHDDCKLYSEQENPLGCLWSICLEKRCQALLD